MYATTIDLGDDTTVVVEQYELLSWLDQLATTRDRGPLADDPAINELVERYTGWRDRHAASLVG